MTDPQITINGTPTGLGDMIRRFGGSVGEPIKAARAMEASSVNVVGVVTNMILIIGMYFLTEALVFGLRTLISVINWVIKFINTVKP